MNKTLLLLLLAPSPLTNFPLHTHNTQKRPTLSVNQLYPLYSYVKSFVSFIPVKNKRNTPTPHLNIG